MSALTLSIVFKPSRRITWSSTSMTRIGFCSDMMITSSVRTGELNRSTLAGLRSDLKFALNERCTFLHAEQAIMLGRSALCGAVQRAEAAAIVFNGDDRRIFPVVHADTGA